MQWCFEQLPPYPPQLSGCLDLAAMQETAPDTDSRVQFHCRLWPTHSLFRLTLLKHANRDGACVGQRGKSSVQLETVELWFSKRQRAIAGVAFGISRLCLMV